MVRGQQLFHPLLLPRRIYRRCCLLRPRSRVLLRWRGSSASCTRLITLVLVSMAAYFWYMTVLAMLLRGGGGVTTRRCMQFSLLRPPPPPLQREVMFQKGGRNNVRVRYVHLTCCDGIKRVLLYPVLLVV